MRPEHLVLFSGATKGAEAAFGQQAEAHGIQEVNFTFEGHPNARARGIQELTTEELLKGDVSLAYVSRLLNRNYVHKGETFRKVLQTLFHIVNHSRELFVVGEILDDGTVKGGTGWGAEFAKLCNKPLYVFDQPRSRWFQWLGETWQALEGERLPVIGEHHFGGTGTRNLQDNGRQAIEELFARSLAQWPS